MVTNGIILIAFLLFPALVIWLVSKFSFLNKIGIVLICYIAGIIVGNIGILPTSFREVQSLMQDVSVALALPLLLFSLDVKGWLKMAKSGMLAMLLAVISIVLITFILHLTIGASLPDGWKLAGMSSALYTGGTPNLAAMKTALQVDNDLYILFNTYDTVFSLLYIFFMSSLAKVFFQKVFKLRPYQVPSEEEQVNASDISDETVAAYKKFLNPSILKGLLAAMLLSCVMLGIAFLISGFFPAESTSVVVILIITSLGIAASFAKPVRKIKYTFHLGMYIIYVFCFAVATMTNLDALVNINWKILIYILVAIFGSMLLHALLCKICKIDSDTMIITSVSAICSPPFVPGVASGIKNKYVLISGLVTGIIGYAIGNYLGIGTAVVYKSWF